MGQSTEELRRDIEQTRSGLGETLDAIGDRVSPSRVMERRKNRMTGAIRAARDRVMGIGVDAGHAVADRTHAMAGGVGGTADSALETVREVPQALKGQTQGSPLAAGAIAFGIGFVAAAAFPASQAEKQVAQNMNLSDHIEPLKKEVTSSAHELADHLKEPAQEALGAIKETAAEGAHTVQASAKEAVAETKEQGQQALRSE